MPHATGPIKIYSSARFKKRSFGHSVFFPGSGDGHLYRVSNPLLDFIANGKMTWMGWVHTDNINRVNRLVRKDGASKGYAIHTEIFGGKNCLCFQNMNGFSARRIALPIFFSRGYHHWAVRYDKTGSLLLEMYINGIQIVNRIGTDITSGTLTDDTTSQLRLGSEFNGDNLEGWMNEVLFFNGQYLTQDQIIRNFLYGEMPRNLTTRELIPPTAHYKMNDNTGRTVLDYSGNNLHMTMNANSDWSNHVVAP